MNKPKAKKCEKCRGLFPIVRKVKKDNESNILQSEIELCMHVPPCDGQCSNPSVFNNDSVPEIMKFKSEVVEDSCGVELTGEKREQLIAALEGFDNNKIIA